MATEYTQKAIDALDSADVEFGDARAQTQKELTSAIVYALLEVARAVRSSK